LSEEENTEDVTPEETPEAAAEETPAAEEVVEETAEVEVEETAEAEEVVEGEVEGAEGEGEVEVEEAATEAAEEIVAEEETPAAPAATKSDLPPGADLEPLTEPEPEENLSAEELAAREAEEEERAAREAAEEEDEDAPVAKPAPVTLAKDARFIATGKRKRSVARVIVLPGDGTITINDREIDEYFPRARHRTIVNSPLVATGYESNVNIKIRVHGGGISGQAGAVRHGIARALTEVDPELRPELKRRGFLTRDARAKERRKAGLKKARKRPQFSKR
jgi:small subunit ribosomal protein S9